MQSSLTGRFSRSLPSLFIVTLTIGLPIASAQQPTDFFEQPGEREFSGSLTARPLQYESHRANGLSNRAARQRDSQARFAMEAYEVTEYVPETDEYIFRVPLGSTENSVASELLATGNFQYVEPDWIVYPIACPNDPLLGSQWHHNANRMDSCSGWDLHTGLPSVGVGICDTGIRTTHQDLLLHRLEGYNAVNQVWENNGGDISPVHPHGTWVTGTSAANGDNGVGVSGVGWNLSHRMMRVSNNSSGSAALSVLNHAARTSILAGDRVANVSYSGVDSSTNLTTATFIKANNGLLVWSAGNDGRNLTFGNRDADDIIVVGATNQSDNLASFSAFGPFVDLTAPGVSILTTDWSSNSSYGSVSGTSFSAPLTAGVVAMIWSYCPTLTPDEVEAILKGGVDDLGSGGVDNTYGYGRLELEGSLSLVNCGGGPANDDCGNAEVIVGLGGFPFDNTGATEGPSNSCRQGFDDVWFQWTAPSSGIFTVDTCAGAAFDTVLAVWEGSGCPPTNEVDCNDDTCGLQSSVTFTATSGTDYLFQVGAFSATAGEGSGTLSISAVGPPNDTCATAQPIAGEGSFPFDSTGAVSDGPSPTCVANNQDVWFEWTAPFTGTFMADTCATTAFDSGLAVWDASGGCPPATEVACNDDGCSVQSSVSFAATVGETFFIQIGAFSGGEGPGELTISGFDPCSTDPDDGLEDNDACFVAVAVGEGNFPDLFVWKSDTDWYSISVPAGATLTVDALFINDDGDIDMELFDSCGGTSLDGSFSVTDNEQVMWTNTGGGTVAVRLNVYVFSSSAEDCNDYDMLVDIEVGDIGVKYCSANANSTGSPADLAASGSASSGAGDLTLTSAPVPNQPGIFFHGQNQINVPFGNGRLCTGGDLKRGRVVNASGNQASYTYDNSENKRDLSAFIGTNRNFQHWFRDPMGGGAGFNTSNAISIDILP